MTEEVPPETLSSTLNSTGDSLNSYRAALAESETKKDKVSDLTMEEFADRTSKILKKLSDCQNWMEWKRSSFHLQMP